LLTEDIQDAIYEELGRRIKEARNKENVNQELLATYLDLSRISISNIEAGKQKIQLHTLLDLVKFLHIDIGELLKPLSSLLIDQVSASQEKRIQTALSNSSTSENVIKKDLDQVKGFMNFVKSKTVK
jgi:transcriptional regulator with XRE-family HTH domain